ncbi:hypothetical protein CN432_09435 [Bacillus thuringiensis]|uniref:hypothetical protein n=1 Tax=Bacillus thuringiensis TaxID=1428 RepID=UPI000BF27054|nr:hypothetical protein [Bacillus thuringiensis]PEV50550.1 hypothetical protein CN432_09435 [Bacillus thuringiensis]PGM24890.1 hypothetical protein CN932_19260 [Bacillus thuringiensis]
MKFFKRINNDNFYELVKDFPELRKLLDLHTEEELFELGYCVLEDSILAIRSIDLGSTFNKSIRNELCFWVQDISNVIHNIPEKLRLRDTTFLKEELYKAITVLYSLKQRRFEGILISNARTEQFIKNVKKRGIERCTKQNV